MKILSLGLDNSILNKSSTLAERAVKYGNLVEKYDIIVPGPKAEKISLSEKVKVYGSDGRGKLARFFKILEIGKKLWREEKYDIITVQDQYYLALVGLKLARKFKVGLEIQVHGFEKFYGLRKLIARYVLPRAEVVRCVSQRLEKQLISQFGVPEEKILIVPIYAPRATHYAPRATRQGKNFIFLTVGRLASVKNIELQIRALAAVVKKFPQTKLWIVGDGAQRKKLEKLCKELRVTRYE